MTNTADLASINVDALIEGRTADILAITAEIQERFPAALAAFVARLQAASDAYFAAVFPTLTPDAFSVDAAFRGKRFARIVRRGEGDSCSVVCFVELRTGLVWKAGTFKAPVLNFSRGCVFALGTAWQRPDGTPATVHPHY